MIAVSRKNVPGGTFELVSMLDYTPTEKFDAAYAILSFFHFDKGELEEAVRKWGTWVREGGWMFIGTICAEDSAWKEDGGIVWSEDGVSISCFTVSLIPPSHLHLPVLPSPHYGTLYPHLKPHFHQIKY